MRARERVKWKESRVALQQSACIKQRQLYVQLELCRGCNGLYGKPTAAAAAAAAAQSRPHMTRKRTHTHSSWHTPYTAFPIHIQTLLNY